MRPLSGDALRAAGERNLASLPYELRFLGTLRGQVMTALVLLLSAVLFFLTVLLTLPETAAWLDRTQSPNNLFLDHCSVAMPACRLGDACEPGR